MIIIIIIAAIALCGAIWAINGYNSLIHAQALVKEGWSGIDIQLKRRYDLIPNLVATVKGYATHEKGLFETIAQARAASMGAHQVGQKAVAEGQLTSALKTLFAIVEQYPDLKANQSFLSLQKDLSAIEDEVHLARRYYNGATRNYNILIRQFPRNIIASLGNFSPEAYFEVSDNKQRETPIITFE